MLTAQFKQFLSAQSNPPSKVTVKNYASDVNRFIRWVEEKFNKDFNPNDVSSVLIDTFKQESLVKYSASSVDRSLSSIRKFFHFLKLEGLISHSPFEQKLSSSAQALEKADPWRIRDFKNHLYVFSASHLTIKNYIIDVKQFLNWAQRVLNHENSWEVSESRIFSSLNAELIEEYKKRLLTEMGLSPVSVNRKLSSIRRYMSWAKEEGLLHDQPKISNLSLGYGLPIDSPKFSGNQAQPETEQAPSYSSLPPLRLVQKAKNGFVGFFDNLLIYPLSSLLDRTDRTIWVIRGKPVFKKGLSHKLAIPNFNILSPKQISNIPKSFYAPALISTKNFSLYSKVWHNVKHSRPEWYKKYHSYSFVSYLHFSILMFFISIMGYLIFDSFKPQNQPQTLAALPSAPARILSFQGRLTDASDNPITSKTTLRMAIYNNLTATGSALLWQEVVSPTPDSDGIFSIILGKGTAIPQSLFAQNSALWLGVTVGTTSELSPRQQITTVAFATNSETLQGLPPITNTSATANVVLALNSSGNLTIGGTASPTFQATGGTFSLSGKILSLTTTASSNGNVIIAPNGTGTIDLQKTIQNTSNNNSLVPGSVQVDDQFSVNTTSPGPALNISQSSSGDLIIASVSGNTKFRVSNNGTITNSSWNGSRISSTYGGTGIDTASSTGVPFVSSGTWSIDANYLFANHGGTGQTSYSVGDILYASSSSQLARLGIGTGSQCLVGGSSPSWGSCGSAGSNWTLSSGAIYPINSTLDLLLGSTATSSAEFAITGINDGLPVATISATTGANSGNGLSLTGATATIQSLRMNTLTLGGATTGNITLAPLNGAAGSLLTINSVNQTWSGTTTLTASSLATITTSSTLALNSASTITTDQTTLTLFDSTATTLNFARAATAINMGASAGTLSLGNGGAYTISTISNDDLNIAPNGTGKVGIFSSTPLGSFDVRPNSGAGGTIAIASISGRTSFAALVVDNSGAGDLFAASSSGATRFRIANDGKIFLGSSDSSETDNYFHIETTTPGQQGIKVNQLATSGTNYAVNGTANGVGPTRNVGLYGWASGASENWGLFIASGSGIFDDRVGIGKQTPIAQLHLTRALSAAGGVTGKALAIFDQIENQDIFTASASGTTRFVITNAGNVGIGTAAPLGTLDVRPNLTNGGTISIASISGSTSFAGLLVDNTGVGDLFTASKSGTTHFVITNAGRVGIGTATPQAKLDIGGSSSTITNTSGNITITPTANLIISAGNTGIGTTTPGFRLDVQDSQAATAAAQIFNTNTGTDADGLIIKLGNTSTTVASTTNHFISFETSGIGIVGSIQGNGGKNVAYVTSGIADFAEHMRRDPNETIEWGSILCQKSNGNVTNCDGNLRNIVGVASEFPTFLGGENLGAGSITVGLSGITYTRVSNANGDISSGDYIASSDIPGIGVKAIKPGMVVGVALENYSSDQVGKILVRVVPSWYDPETLLADTGDLVINQNNNDNYEVQSDGKIIHKIGAFSDLVAARIKTGYFETGKLIVTGSVLVKNLTSETLASNKANFSQLSSDSLAVLSDQLTIGGQNIRDYIANILTEVLNNRTIEQSNNQLARTDIISPLSEEPDGKIAIKLNDNEGKSKLEIINASESAVASIDSEGNATFSGTLTARDGQFNNLTIEQLNNSGNASISGTLRAGKIIAGELELSEEALLNLLGLEPQSSSSSILLASNYEQASASADTFVSTSQQLSNIAIEQLTVEQGLMAYGPSSFFEISVADRLFVGAQLSLADRSINVLGGNLEIQPLKQGGIAFVGGEVEIDTQGNLKVNGNAYFARDVQINGKLAANIIAPIPGEDLIFDLASSDQRLASSSDSPELKINNSSNSAILTINSFGDLSASGAGTFSKLNLNIVSQAQAVSPTEVIATGSAGVAQIQPNKNELTIKNPLVTENSLIYITPKTATPNQSLFLLRQVPGQSFTVGISQSINKKVPFNWILIN